MEEAGERLEAGVHHRAPHVRRQNAVSVVERRVYAIRRALVAAPLEPEVIGSMLPICCQ